MAKKGRETTTLADVMLGDGLPLEEQILRLLAEVDEGVDQEELVARLDRSPTLTRDALARLEADGRVVREPLPKGWRVRLAE